MSNFSIGISGLGVAQTGLNIIGNNIANAATEGYHRQRVELSPGYASWSGELFIGGGVSVDGVTRIIDNLLEQEIVRQSSLLGEVSRELDTLRTVENNFGEFTDANGLNSAINNFFNALRDLSSHPSDAIYQRQTVMSAEAMAGQFNTMGGYLEKLENQVVLETDNLVDNINTIILKVAELNDAIEKVEIGGASANNFRDQRDQSIAELSKLVGIQIQSMDHGVVNISIGGIGVVTGSSVVELDAGLDENGELGISVAGEYNFDPDIQGGTLGGLLSLKNDLISQIHSDLNDLASQIIRQINQIQVQGVGSAGSFTELAGWSMESENLADISPALSDGKFYIRVIDTATGEISRHEIDIDVSEDSLSSIALDISSITGLSASVVSSGLRIQADSGYEFDFLPAVLPEPTESNLTGASVPAIAVSGIYTGTENQTFTFTVAGSGSVSNGNLSLEVTDADGNLINTLNIGSGYAALDKIDIGNGIKISLGAGDLNDGDTFEVDAYASTDTSGVLAAVGMNTFFSGSDAEDMQVCSELTDSPNRIATAIGAEMTDNANAVKLAGFRDAAIDELDGMTIVDFYHSLVAGLGQDVSVKEDRYENLKTLVQELGNQQSEVSGVDINEEAAQLLVFQQMFQAMSKYLSIVQVTSASIMEIV